MCNKTQWKFRLLILLVLGTSHCSLAQLSTCVNADLELGNFTNWTATTGSCCPINSTSPGIVPGRHTIMSGTGTDPNTNGALSVVAPGGLFSARLGNSNTGAQAEQLSYQINVDSGNALFIYRYAVVLEDPNHGAQEQPRFEIRVYDVNGNSVGCGTYNVYASAGIPGFVTLVNQYGSTVRYKNWTTVGIDLTPYIGQTVTIEFSTGDCSLGGHFGYAYVDCYCSPFRILTDFCVGATTTTFTAPQGFASYLWSTGATTQSMAIQNGTVGSQYQCTMTSVTGCTITLTTVLTTTVIASAYGQNNVCSNPVQFFDQSSVVSGSPIIHWLWDFGDGVTSNAQNPVHAYASTGTYNVSLIVTNGGGCKDTVVQSVLINPVLAGNFTASMVCPGSVTDFTDLSTSQSGGIVAWNWSFGDGTPNDSTANPSHIYQVSGSYPVTLVVTDSIGCSDTLLKSVSTLPSPVSGFDYPTVCTKETVIFTDTSKAIGSLLADWEWNFGDGTPLVTGTSTPSHSFAHSGTFNAILVVTDTVGCTDTSSAMITVDPLPAVVFSADTVCMGSMSVFRNLSYISSGSIIGWDWDFGDTAASALSWPVHVYSSSGTFPVSLTATSDKGCVDSAFSTAHVWRLPSPDFMVSDSAGCRTHEVLFSDLSTSQDGTIKSWLWDFGNGTATTSPFTETKYKTAGLYDVKLSVTTSLGCVNDTAKDDFVTVFELPSPDFYYTPDEPTMFVSNVSFIDKSVNAAHWWWDFGDSSTSVLQFPDHFYRQTGNYIVKLVVESADGCLDSTWRQLEVTDSYAFWIPNAFSPDNDGLNDVFMVKGFGYSDLSLSIFNRLGDRIYFSNSNGWDGNYNGQEAPVGVYVYQVKMIDSFEASASL